ncbi:MAG TPA: hypothetical protein VNV43_02615 [Candidatus Acidoferrales bacterium]|jgi:hypothetical protein|nr:hypothetical protein [Candidatus Acidoferrales bacterium]
MRPLTQRDQRAIRYGAIGLGIYLVLFCAFHVWKFFEHRRSDYRDLIQQAHSLKDQIEPYQTKILVVQKLMKEYHLDPAKLTEAAVVAQASEAIQDEANADGIALGAIHESPAQSAGPELASIHIQGNGPVKAMLTLLDRLQRLGYPLVIDSVQVTPNNMQPGQVKFDLTIAVLDFEQWKNPEAAHA